MRGIASDDDSARIGCMIGGTEVSARGVGFARGACFARDFAFTGFARLAAGFLPFALGFFAGARLAGFFAAFFAPALAGLFAARAIANNRTKPANGQLLLGREHAVFVLDDLARNRRRRNRKRRCEEQLAWS